MEGRPNRGRGGSWRRGGRGGHDGDSFGGEYRGRGRGGHHRGRGKRDHYRGRGRGGGAHAAEFQHRDRDEGDNFQEEDNEREVFSRRKLESNWDRYKESEKQEPDDDTPTQRGTDYHVLLESAGDSFTQFRFSEEKDWEMDSLTASQMSAVFLDLPALAQSLQQLPLYQRLNLEAELVQVLTPVELPAVSATPKQELPKKSTFAPPSKALNHLNTNHKVAEATNTSSSSNSAISSNLVAVAAPAAAAVAATVVTAAEPPADDGDEELDQLLGLQKPVNQPASVTDEESAAPEKECEEMKEVISEVTEEKMEVVKDVTSPKAAPAKQEMTEEDLEDWLDSMIS